MDPIHNPYAPGAGTQPPELAGRDDLREQVRIATERIRLGKSSKSVMLIGLRGVGKTVLLERMRLDAEDRGHYTLKAEAPENRSLPALLAPQLRQALLRISRNQKAKEFANRALSVLSGFVQAIQVRYEDVIMSLDFDPEPGIADNGDLETDLQDLLETVALAAQKADSSLIMFLDELQYVEEHQLASLITALHRIAQRSLPLTLVGAGLPQLPGQMGKAKSYAERLFDFPFLKPLTREQSFGAIRKPAREGGVEFKREALEEIFQQTRGYPYFLQEWGKHSWDCAEQSPIGIGEVRQASMTAKAALDESFFKVRFERMTPQERDYLRCMAELGAGPHRSGKIAELMGREVRSLGPTRKRLIEKGMIWSPSHGDTAFTVPLFDKFMKRIIPEMSQS